MKHNFKIKFRVTVYDRAIETDYKSLSEAMRAIGRYMEANPLNPDGSPMAYTIAAVDTHYEDLLAGPYEVDKVADSPVPMKLISELWEIVQEQKFSIENLKIKL